MTAWTRTATAPSKSTQRLYNRRGYATFVECPGCGQAYDCPSCAIAMVYNQKIARLDCHYCGFHSAERTFALVTQLCGRAGRGDILGQVFLQTHHPEHPVFATIGDMDAFAAQEDRFRRMLRYPPFARLVLLRCEAVDRPAAFGAANQIARDLRQAAASVRGVDVLRPTTAPLPRLVGRWRYQVILRGTDPGPFRRFLTERSRLWKVPHGVRLIVDVDPRSLA